ncbi:repetitive proline-rich cell wall protein-like [Aplysia californica]|uniref:Repetitive proline-rich cell wall protein-like n=1 Tax=Aplysia californica TaxID=6500 RepID=A0ABM1AC70_APLCA|nr:repetitive proline-rich cell wall protein-like [Aplysia californica]
MTTPHPVVNPYIQPQSRVCPHERYTLYSFFYANKDCYVIYPDVQKVTYVQCSASQNRDCQECSYHGGVSKCEEDYEYRDVWAYCTYKPTLTPVVKPQPVYPVPVRPVVDPKPPVYPLRPTVVNPRPPTYPVYNPPVKAVYPPQGRITYPYPATYKDPWNKVYKPYVLQQKRRWKRSYHEEPQGKIERMPLYLPYHCGCKRYHC